MSYKKPEVVAESEPRESYVAGCPEKDKSTKGCRYCERSG